MNKILPSLSPAPKVKRTDSRGRKNQQTPFEESFEQEQKKKKKDDRDRVIETEDRSSLKILPSKGSAAAKSADKAGQTRDTLRHRLIDIRV